MAFSLALIIILGLGGDYLFKRLQLPGLIGMLIVGVLVGPYVLNFMSPEMMKVSGDFRKIALIVILLRAGFELRRDALKRVGRATVIMSSLPAVFEIGGVMLVAPRLLNMTYLEAAILGSILAAVSPAVVVPLMIDFMDRGRGAKKAIPTMILGASSLDDVFVIVLFTVFLGMYGGEQTNILMQLGAIPVSIVLGIIVGIIPGYFLTVFIQQDLVFAGFFTDFFPPVPDADCRNHSGSVIRTTGNRGLFQPHFFFLYHLPYTAGLSASNPFTNMRKFQLIPQFFESVYRKFTVI